MQHPAPRRRVVVGRTEAHLLVVELVQLARHAHRVLAVGALRGQDQGVQVREQGGGLLRAPSLTVGGGEGLGGRWGPWETPLWRCVKIVNFNVVAMGGDGGLRRRWGPWETPCWRCHFGGGWRRGPTRQVGAVGDIVPQPLHSCTLLISC